MEGRLVATIMSTRSKDGGSEDKSDCSISITPQTVLDMVGELPPVGCELSPAVVTPMAVAPNGTPRKKRVSQHQSTSIKHQRRASLGLGPGPQQEALTDGGCVTFADCWS